MVKTYTIWFKSGDRKIITDDNFKLIHQALNSNPSKKLWMLNSDLQPVMMIDIDEIFLIDPNN